MKPRQRVGKAQKAQSPRQEEKRAQGNQDDRPKAQDGHRFAPFDRDRRLRRSPPLLTNATEAKAASKDRTRATSAAADNPPPAERSSTAIPPVPNNCAAIIRSASSGPRRTLTSPSATVASTKMAAHRRNSRIECLFS